MKLLWLIISVFKKNVFIFGFSFEMFCLKISCFKQFDLRGRIEQTRPYMGPKVFMNMVKAIRV